MNRLLTIAACAIAWPGTAPAAATRAYEVGAFEEIAVAAGVEAEVVLGPTRSVVAQSGSDSFDDLRIGVDGKTLRIDRTPRSWLYNLFTWDRESYRVRVVTPTLHALSASSGAEVTVDGAFEGDISFSASSGSDVEVAGVRAGAVKVSASSGTELDLAGTCVSLEASASSGSDVDAKDLSCENVTVRASSGSDVSVTATKRVDGEASSGADVVVRGKPAVVQVNTSSGAALNVRQ